MPEYDVDISSSGWNDEEIQNLSDMFANLGIHVSHRSYYEFSTESIDPVFLLTFTYVADRLIDNCIKTITDSTFNLVINKVTSQIASRHKKSKLLFKFKDTKQELKLDIQSDDPNVIKLAVETIETFLHSNKFEQKYNYAFFNINSNKWDSLIDRKIEFYRCGVMATANKEFQKNGKIHSFTKLQLQDYVENFVPVTVNLEHIGPPIGSVSTAWLDGDKLCVKIGIFSDVDKRLKKKIKKGGLGLSPELTWYIEGRV